MNMHVYIYIYTLYTYIYYLHIYTHIYIYLFCLIELLSAKEDSNNRIALMQFADRDTALLLRTHRTERWLPTVLKQVLASETCPKICVGWDGADKKKL